MSIDNYLLNPIKSAEKDPVFYRIIQNVAYYLHTLNPNNQSEDNWYIAQQQCEKWFARFGLTKSYSITEFAERILNNGGKNCYAFAQEIVYQNNQEFK